MFVTFFIMRTRGSRRAHEEKKKKVCWSAIGSDSLKLVYTQTLVDHLEFTFFTHFQVFSIVLAHANACVRWSKYTTHVILKIHST